MNKLGQLVDTVGGYFFPENCQLCRRARATPAEGYVCAECWRGVRFVVAPYCERCGLPFEGAITNSFECGNCRDMELAFDSARAAVHARGVVLEAVHRFKYQGAAWFGKFLGGLLSQVAVPALRAGNWDALVPVPLHPAKEREREFNQAEILARSLGAATGLPVETSWLARREFTQTQTLLTRERRAVNMRGAFAVNAGASLTGRRIVIVDDVLTTGATTSACARELRRAGAASICVWTVARGV